MMLKVQGARLNNQPHNGGPVMGQSRGFSASWRGVKRSHTRKCDSYMLIRKLPEIESGDSRQRRGRGVGKLKV